MGTVVKTSNVLFRPVPTTSSSLQRRN